MIIKKRLYLPLCKYLRPCALFCAFMLITSLKRTAQDEWYSFFVISCFPFLSTLQKYFVLQWSFPKIYQNVFPLIWDGLKTWSAFPLPSSPFSLLCWIAYFLYLLFTLIHPFSSPRSLVPGFIVPCTSQHSTVSTNCALEMAKDCRD